MALSKEAYQVLEDIVGPENISAEPVILDTYTWMMDAELWTPNRSGFWVQQPEAAVLPGSAEEVQAIVKACNRYGVKIKAFSTGWSPCVLSSTGGVINLDLRRMNRILEIDEKNMVAVVEPYVIVAQLQAEAMKLGLNAHLTGAGGSCSTLASATSGGGTGPDTLFHGTSGETLLAAEWVMPGGEILRTGSLGAGAGWFGSEGPGPSLRGVFRAGAGAMGALGVFTRCAVKLAPWPGPAVMPVEGVVPAYNSPLPENLRAYTLALPSWSAFADAHYKIYDAEIGYVAEGEYKKLGEDLAPAFMAIYSDPTKSLDDLEEFVNKPEIRKLTDELRHYSFQLVLAGMTPRDIEYQEKVLDQILAETGGHRSAAMSEPTMEKFTLLFYLRLPTKHTNNVLAGGRRGSFSPSGTPDLAVKYVPPVIEQMRKWQDKGVLVKAGADSLKGRCAAIGGGGILSYEQFTMWDPADIDSVNGTREYFADNAKLSRELHLPGRPPPGNELWSTEERQPGLAASSQPARWHWQWKVRQMLDPHDAIDSMSYPRLEKPLKE